MFEILGVARDHRSGTNVIYAKCSIPEYLHLIGKNFSKFEIQRSREKYKTYERLRHDILQGALLPPITLAVKLESAEKIDSMVINGDNSGLRKELLKIGNVNILDGLQRTYILSELWNKVGLFDDPSGHDNLSRQTVLLEFWIEKELKNLIYRIIVLNAGQKPMSISHQIEILSVFLSETLHKNIPAIQIHTKKSSSSRSYLSYALSDVAASYQCFLTKSPDLDKYNLVAQRMSEESVLDLSDTELDSMLSKYIKYFNIYHQIAEIAFGRYTGQDRNWITSSNVMQSLFAALAVNLDAGKEDRAEIALRALIEDKNEDFLGLRAFQNLISGSDTKRFNVGFITRRTLFFGFKEFIRDKGETSLSSCWQLSTE